MKESDHTPFRGGQKVCWIEENSVQWGVILCGVFNDNGVDSIRIIRSRSNEILSDIYPADPDRFFYSKKDLLESL